MAVYFTEEERKQVVSHVRALLRHLGDAVTGADVRGVRSLIEEGVASGAYGRDAHGLNPVLQRLHTARLLCDLVVADRRMVVATLLSDLCVVGSLTVERVGRLYGDDVERLVRGLHQVSQLYGKRAAVRDDNFHKLLLSLAEDLRVIIILIVGNLALMRTINHHPDQAYVRAIATESRHLHIPLAHRLGLYTIKSELEDTSLKYLNAKIYHQIASRLNATKEVRDAYVDDFIKPIDAALRQSGLKFEIKGRTKSINSIWNKMRTKDVDLNGMYDLFAIRIILDTPRDAEKKACWIAYSIVTDIYTANIARLRDWITIPKSNGYESLHITVHGPDDKWVEVQIRTRRMDAVAERGVAAHWRYKGVKSDGSGLDEWMKNAREILETGSRQQLDLLRNMDVNLYDKEIYVFTPKGDIFHLPQGATVLDFAYHIHSKVGSHAVGGKVDGKNQKLNHRLRNGDTVEILTQSSQTPRLDWLNFVTTARARTKIRQAVNETRVRQADLARETLQRRFKNRKIDVDEALLSRLQLKMGYKSVTDFFVAIEQGDIDVNDVVARYEALVRQPDASPAAPRAAAEDFVLPQEVKDDKLPADILVIGDGVKDINYQFSRCCNPIMGDAVVGFVASSGVIKIHRTDCPNVRHLQTSYPYRIIKTQWSGRLGGQFGVKLKVVGRDDIGIVASISSVINKSGQNQLRSISVQSHGDMFEGMLVVGVSSIDALDDLMKRILNVKGVKQVERV